MIAGATSNELLVYGNALVLECRYLLSVLELGSRTFVEIIGVEIFAKLCFKEYPYKLDITNYCKKENSDYWYHYITPFFFIGVVRFTSFLET
jgi:hypothetical protein